MLSNNPHNIIQSKLITFYTITAQKNKKIKFKPAENKNSQKNKLSPQKKGYLYLFFTSSWTWSLHNNKTVSSKLNILVKIGWTMWPIWPWLKKTTLFKRINLGFDTTKNITGSHSYCVSKWNKKQNLNKMIQFLNPIFQEVCFLPIKFKKTQTLLLFWWVFTSQVGKDI